MRARRQDERLCNAKGVEGFRLQKEAFNAMGQVKVSVLETMLISGCARRPPATLSSSCPPAQAVERHPSRLSCGAPPPSNGRRPHSAFHAATAEPLKPPTELHHQYYVTVPTVVHTQTL